MRIALASNGDMGVALMRAIQASQHELVAVVRDGQSGSPTVRALDLALGLLGGPLTLEGRALLGGVPMRWLRRQDEREAARLARHRPDLLLVANFGMILRRPILAVPTVGAINVHWSLLPKHRGPSPSTSVLLSGDEMTGVTFHVVTPRIDGGDILEQASFPVPPRATAASLYYQAVREASERVGPLLDRIAAEGLVGTPQDLSAGSYRRRITLEQARLDFAQPAEVLDRMVRALVQPMARTEHRGRTLYISAARRVDGVTGVPGTIVQVRPEVMVACGADGLAIERAWTLRPPAPWPAPWTRLTVGDRLGARALSVDPGEASG